MFFYTGYAAAPLVLALAARFSVMPIALLAGGLVCWAIANAVGVGAGIALTPGPSLLFSYAGVAAVIAFSVLLVRVGLSRALAYCGQHSIVIYLAFALFLSPTRVILMKVGALPLEAVALLTTAVSVAGALLLRDLVRGSRLDFLFVRPAAFKLRALGPLAASPPDAAPARPDVPYASRP